MKRALPKNLPASIQERLRNRTSRTGEDLQYVLMRYAVERLLYRLANSPHRDHFIVKGAMLFLVWTGEVYRPTKDLDLLALKSSTVLHLQHVFQAVVAVQAGDDGLVFPSESVHAEEIRENQAYQGVRVKLMARLGKVRIPVQVDVGFGDTVTPSASSARFPGLLDLPTADLAIYPRESVVSEKLEAMVKLGIANSRMKDFYDIWALSQGFEFNGRTLSSAIRATFRRRKTILPVETPLALTDEFAGDAAKQTQWRAFIGRGAFRIREGNFLVVVRALNAFLMPPLVASREARAFEQYWPPQGPWKPQAP